MRNNKLENLLCFALLCFALANEWLSKPTKTKLTQALRGIHPNTSRKMGVFCRAKALQHLVLFVEVRSSSHQAF